MNIPNKPSDMLDANGRFGGIASSIRLLSPTAQFLCAGAIGLCGIVLIGQILIGGGLPAGVLVGSGSYALALVLALISLRKSYPHNAIGFCNVVTIVRLMLAAVLVAALITPTPADWGVFAIALAAFLLDGVDGWLARREGYASAFGARFDMEVDSVLALVLALYAYQSGSAGALVVLLGLPRYLFVIAQYPFPWLDGDLPDRFSRKVVCVLQISVLLFVITPLASAPFAGIAVGIAAMALVWSFWLDVRWLWVARA